MKKTIVIYDTEYTSWEGAQDVRWSHPGQHREVVQIAARKWTLGEDWRTGAVFYKDVRPKLNPQLSTFFKQLTLMRQKDVDNADSAAVVLRQFSKFIGKTHCWSNGNDINVVAETSGLQRFILPLNPEQFHTLEPRIYDKIEQAIGPFEQKGCASGNMYKLLKIKFDKAHEHDALHDVNSLCATIERLMELGIQMQYLWNNTKNNPNNFKHKLK